MARFFGDSTKSHQRVATNESRRFDILFSLIGLILFSPLMFFISVMILCDDRGPILFRQPRVGHRRVSFLIFKFRTMNCGKFPNGGNTESITRIGRWLRRTGLDELPQFINVLRGEMSIVGPRPLTASDIERLGWNAPRFAKRWNVRPGITGLAQIFAATPRAAWALDRLYIRRTRLALDLRLIAISFVINFLGKKAMRKILRRRRRKYADPCPSLKHFSARAWRGVSAPPVPRAFREAPLLDPTLVTPPPTRGEVLLINPFYAKDPHASFGKHVLTPTLALTSIAAATPPEYHVTYRDENLLQGPPPCNPFPEFVGITVHLTFARRAFELAAWFQARGSKVILGGLHVLSNPDECAPHADAIVLGEGVSVWPEVLADLRANRAQKRYTGSYKSPYRTLPDPQRAILPRRSFLTTTSIIATRGCHNRCGFCYLATDGLTMPYQMLDPEQVVRQMESDDQPYSVFIDNNLGSRPDYLRKLCRALRPLQRIWSAAVTIDITDDPSLAFEMARAGCTGVFIGFESLSGENLDDAKKKSPRPGDYARRVKILHDCGIQVNGSFVLGFDHDGPGCFEQLADWVEETRLECATYHVLTPYPGTPLFRALEAEHRILHRNWDLYDTAHVVFRPKRMSPETLAAGYHWLYQRTFTIESIWRRRPERLSSVLAYMGQSLLYKKSNLFWEFLIRNQLVATAWRPLVELHRARHFRELAKLESEPKSPASETENARPNPSPWARGLGA